MKEILVRGISVSVADSFFARLLGLLPERAPDERRGLLIRPCRQVHTFGMRFPIDVVFLSGGHVVHIEHTMRPGRVSRYVKEADSVLEIAPGLAEKKSITLGEALLGGKNDVSSQ